MYKKLSLTSLKIRIFKVGILIVNLLIISFLIRELCSENYGIYATLFSLVNWFFILNSRNLLDKEIMEEIGFNYRSIG